MPATKGLMERIRDGETVIMAEGYLFELERRGYLQAGAFVPEVVLEHPEVVRSVYEEFAHCGSDVVLAFTYYGHRAKLRLVNKEANLEALNRKALKMAREVADKTGTLMAGNLCNSTTWKNDDEESKKLVRDMHKEQVEWAVQEGADFILGETFSNSQEAKAALEAIKKYGNGLPAVINLIPGVKGETVDGVPLPALCRELEELGADVVGLNCALGPDTMMPIMREVKKACKGPLACLPVPFRTSNERPAFQTLQDELTGKKAFPGNLAAHLCSRSHIEKMTKDLQEMKIDLVGLCCGAMPAYIRTMAETYGRTPPASAYSPDMSGHRSELMKTQFSKYNPA